MTSGGGFRAVTNSHVNIYAANAHGGRRLTAEPLEFRIGSIVPDSQLGPAARARDVRSKGEEHAGTGLGCARIRVHWVCVGEASHTRNILDIYLIHIYIRYISNIYIYILDILDGVCVGGVSHP